MFFETFQTVADLLSRLVSPRAPSPDSNELNRRMLARRRWRLVSENLANDKTQALGTWQQLLDSLDQDMSRYGIENMLRWSAIQQSMFAVNNYYVLQELRALTSDPQWANKWRPLLRETTVGSPPRTLYYPFASGNLIHHAFHIQQFETVTGDSLNSYKMIVEFGGGYGSMCRLAFSLGFRGQYIIYDFPFLNVLQEYYLTSHGIRVTIGDNGQVQPAENSVLLLSAVGALRAAMSAANSFQPRLLVAMWSLTEAPMKIRREFLAALESFDSLLLSFCEIFEGLDNYQYCNSTFATKPLPIPHLPGNFYSIHGRDLNEAGENAQISLGTTSP